MKMWIRNQINIHIWLCPEFFQPGCKNYPHLPLNSIKAIATKLGRLIVTLELNILVVLKCRQ